MRRNPQATPAQKAAVERLLDQVFDAVARREMLGPGETISIEGVEFSRKHLDRYARLGRNHLRRLGCETSAIYRQLILERRDRW